MSVLSCFPMLIPPNSPSYISFVQNHTQAVAQHPCLVQMSCIFYEFLLSLAEA